MKSNLRKIINNSFVRNVIILASGTIAAQALNFILSPIITRLYGPEAYGLMGTFMSMVTIITPIAALTYPIAIVLPKSDYVAKGIVRLSLYVTAGISGITLLVLLFFKDLIVNTFHLEEISPFLYLIPFVICSAGILQVIEQWLIRTKQFKITAKAVFLQAFLTNGGKVGIGFFHPTSTVLIILSALSNGLKALLLILFTKGKNKKGSDEKAVIKVSIKQLAREYRDFPIFRAPESFLHAFTHGLPTLLLSSFFGPVSAGFYSIARTVLHLPTLLIGKSVGDVFYPRISEATHNEENLTSLIKKATISLALVGFIPFGLIFAFGPWLFGFVFGNEWVMAGEYARWLSIGIFFGFMKSPCIRALPVMSAQVFHFAFSVINMIIQIGSLIIGYYLFTSDLIAIAFFGISGAILNLGLIIVTLNISRNFDKKQHRHNRKYI